MTAAGGAALVLATGLAFGAAAWLLRPYLAIAERGGLVRSNFAGRPIPTAAGVPVAMGAAFGMGAGAALGGLSAPPAFVFAAAALGFALIGLCDDVLKEETGGGLTGHWRAFRDGRATSGGFKAIAGGLLALSLGAVAGSCPGCPGESLGGAGQAPAAWAIDALLIALSANAWNLLDVRPGRALKAFWGAGLLLAAGGAAPLWPALGAAAAVGRADLRAQAMLGDAGANALGALVGVASAAALPLWARAAILIGLGGLHAAAERTSIGAWIERLSLLAWLDRLGRR